MCFEKSMGKNVNVTDVRAKTLFVDVNFYTMGSEPFFLWRQMRNFRDPSVTNCGWKKKRTLAKLSTSKKIQKSILMPDPFAAEGMKTDKVKVQNWTTKFV